MAESWRAFLKNEATDSLENKGPGCGKVRNEATVGGERKASVGSRQWAVGSDKQASWQWGIVTRKNLFLGSRSHDVIENAMAGETARSESRDVYENKGFFM
jgi:hypothetical protein